MWIWNPTWPTGLWLADTFTTSSQVQLQGYTPHLAQTFLLGYSSSVVTLYMDLKSKIATLASDRLTHFQEWCRYLLQTWHRCFLWVSIQVLLLFMWIQNPIWPLWSLIGWHVFNFFSRVADWFYSKVKKYRYQAAKQKEQSKLKRQNTRL